MEILKILGLVILKDSDYQISGRPSKIMTLKTEHEWFKSEECKSLLSGNDSELPDEVKEILGR